MTTYRWTLAGVAPNDIYRALQLVNAVKSWDDGARRDRYQLGDCQVEVFEGSLPTLMISGPTAESARDAAGRLGYLDTQGTITRVEDEVPVTRAKNEVPARR